MLVDYATGLMTINLQTGNRSYFTKGTSPQVGTGPHGLFTDIILESNGDVITWDLVEGFIRVDADTGNRSLASIVAPGGFDYPFVENEAGSIFYWNTFSSELKRFDPITQDDVVVSSESVGSGPDFMGPVDIQMVTGRLFILEQGRLLEIDTATGNRTVVADGSSGSPVNPNASFAPFDMAIELSNNSSIETWAMFD